MREPSRSLPVFVSSPLLLFFFTLTICAQNIAIDVLSARTDTTLLTVRLPVSVAVPPGVFPTSIQFDMNFNVGDLRLDRLVEGPAALAAAKAARQVTISPGRVQIIIEGRSIDPINSGTLLFLEFYQLALTPKVSPISLSAQLVMDAANRRLNSTVNGARAILNDGIQLPTCPSALPAECRGSQLVVPEGASPMNEILFSQMASGVQSAQFGGYETKIIITNMMDSPGDALLEFYGQNGQPLNTTIGDDLDNTFYFRIPGRGTTVVETNNLGPTAIGWLRVRSLISIGGSILYSFLDPNRLLVSEAGILPSVYRKSFEFTVDTRANMNVGLAAANSGINLMTLNCQLYNQGGAPVAQRNITIGGMGQAALVLSQIFPGIDFRDFIGKVTVSVAGQGYVLATTLRFSNDLRVFASLPVI